MPDACRKALRPTIAVLGRHAEVVLAVERDHALGQLRNRFEQLADHARDLVRSRAAHGVGQVDRVRARLDGGSNDARQEARIGARRVHGTELHVGCVRSRAGHALAHGRLDLVGPAAQLVHHVDLGAADEDVDARLARRPHGLPGAVDVAGNRPGARAALGSP